MHLCKSNDGASCGTDARWHDGWILFYDENTNRQREEGELVLRTRRFAKPAVAISNRQREEGELVLRTRRFAKPAIAISFPRGYLYMKPDGSFWPIDTFELYDCFDNVKPQSIVVHFTRLTRKPLPSDDSSDPIGCE